MTTDNHQVQQPTTYEPQIYETYKTNNNTTKFPFPI